MKYLTFPSYKHQQNSSFLFGTLLLNEKKKKKKSLIDVLFKILSKMNYSAHWLFQSVIIYLYYYFHFAIFSPHKYGDAKFSSFVLIENIYLEINLA